MFGNRKPLSELTPPSEYAGVNAPTTSPSTSIAGPSSSHVENLQGVPAFDAVRHLPFSLATTRMLRASALVFTVPGRWSSPYFLLVKVKYLTFILSFKTIKIEAQCCDCFFITEHAAPPTLTLLSAWSSNVTCNVALRCAVSPDTALNTTCIIDLNSTESESVCSQEGGGRFLSISVNRTTVSCNHSNPVSWRRASVDVASVCSGWGGVSVSLLRATAISGVIVVMVTAVIAVAICTRRPQTSD
ncbi:uncharacterized protein LOC134444289 [Engraulis encrasicolus]|uniref:uncharacterized protein LOC134444289 n=1 Tax=Engraulis encrasicolus TaxID=184585 RepID=UPI002FD662AF